MTGTIRRSRLAAGALLLLLALGLACSKKGGGTSPLQPPAATATLTGIVYGSNGGGLPLSGATVASVPAAGASATSNALGVFTLTVPAGSPITVTASRAGFAEHPFQTQLTTGETRAVTLVIRPLGGTSTVTAAAGGKVTDATSRAAITLPAGFVTGHANAVVGVTGLDPTTEDALAFPGTIAAESSVGALLSLAPVASAEVRIGDGVGADYPLAGSATLEMRLATSLQSDNVNYGLGFSIPCFSWDEASGRWKFYANGSIETSSVDGQKCVRLTVTHLTWFAAGLLNGSNACVSGVVTSNGLPVSGATVQAFPGTTDLSKADGSYRVSAPPNAHVEIVASRPATGSVRIASGAVTSGGAGGSCASQALALQFAGPPPTFTIAGQIIRGRNPLGVPFDQAFVSVVANTSPNPTPLNGSAVQIGDGLTWRTIPFKSNGLYSVPSGFTLVAGTTYTLRVDLEPDGAFDATAAVLMPGKPQINAPTADQLVDPSFTATWTDPAAGVGLYTAHYIGSIESGSFGNFPAQFVVDAPAASRVIGTGTGQPQYFMTNDPLLAGSYLFRLWATNGPVRFAVGNQKIFTDPNITGATNVSGWFSAIAIADSIPFNSLGSGTAPRMALRAGRAR